VYFVPQAEKISFLAAFPGYRFEGAHAC